jgi:6-pyruvoyltetrahydropterin/6-carboxytetrahydropterin synthase
MWEISKEFNISYGHRVWSQQLNEKFSLDTCSACRFLHGHNARIIVTMSSELLKSGMVTDFKHLNWFKQWLDDVLDHKFIMDLHDPLINHEIYSHFNIPPKFISKFDNYFILDPEEYKDFPTYVKEKFEGMIFVSFVPTSENLSEWLFNIVSERMQEINVKITKIEFFETLKSKSIFING